MTTHARHVDVMPRILAVLFALFSLRAYAADPIDVSELEILELRGQLAEHLVRIVALEAQVDELQEDKAALEKIVAQHNSDLAALRADVDALKAKPGETPTLTLKAPFVVIGNGGRELLRVNDDASGAQLAAPFRVTSNNQPRLQVTATALNARGTFRLDNESGSEIARISPFSDGTAMLTVGDRSRGGISAGVGKSGNGFVTVNNPTGKPAINMGTPNGAPLGVYVMGADGEKVRASMGLDENQKAVLRVGDPKGYRGVLGETKSGGIGFALFDKADADYRVAMMASSDNSFVRLNSHKNAVHMNADGSGSAMHIFNAQGNSAATLESTANGFGKLSIGNADGDTVVQAGTTTEGLGVVRAGPNMGGQTGMSALPFAIMGRQPKGGAK